jgi:hypothetical protein
MCCVCMRGRTGGGVCAVAGFCGCREGEMRRSCVDHVTHYIQHCIYELGLRRHLRAVLYAAI